MLVGIADDGTSGWGECYGLAEVCQAAITGFYGPRLLGLDPLATGRHWHGTWQWSLDFARGGVMMATHFLASGYREPGRAEDGGAVLELDRTPNPLRDELFERPVEIDRATVHVTTAPGLGVVVNRSALQPIRVKETEIR